MNPRLRLLFDALETERHRLLEQVARLSPQQFHRTEQGKWSISQILAHLVAAESLSLEYMKKKILGIDDAGNTGIADELIIGLLKISQRLPLKFRAPKVVIENTQAYPEVNQLKAEWDSERAELKGLLEAFHDTQLKKKIYRHVVAGRLNIQHALIFFREHYFHHLPQIKRLL